MNVQYSVDPYSMPDQSGADQGLLQDQYGSMADQGGYYSNGTLPQEGGIMPDEYGGAGAYGEAQQMDPSGGMMAMPSAHMPESPYLGQLVYERQSLDPNMLPQTCGLVDHEIERLRNDANPATHRFPEPMFANPFHHKIRVVQKIAMPLDEYPSLNFGGNIIGKNGENILRLKEETKCKIMIFGRGSINNRERESSLLNSGDPKYAHLCQELHVHLETYNYPQQAYESLAKAIEAIGKCFKELIETSGATPRRGGGGGGGGGGRMMGGGGGHFGGGQGGGFRGRGGRGGGDGGGFGRGGGRGGRGGMGGGGGNRGGYDGQRGGGRGGGVGGGERRGGGRGGRGAGGFGGGSARYAPY